jgi:hypothetical protein
MNPIHIKRLQETTALMLANPAHHNQDIWHYGCWAGFGDLVDTCFGLCFTERVLKKTNT